MYQYISSLQCTTDKLIGFLEMLCHFVAGLINSIDDFVIYLELFGIDYVQHGSCC